MPKIKNIGGSHTFLDGTVVDHGEVFETDIPLEKIQARFPNKFVGVSDSDPVANKAPTPAEEESEPEDASGEDDDDLGEDVTEDFPAAKEQDLTVRKLKGKWHVWDGDEQINEEPLKKSEVAGVIADYLS